MGKNMGYAKEEKKIYTCPEAWEKGKEKERYPILQNKR